MCSKNPKSGFSGSEPPNHGGLLAELVALVRSGRGAPKGSRKNDTLNAKVQARQFREAPKESNEETASSMG